MASGPTLASHVRTVIVLRALSGIGDHLCSIPALRALRAALPEAHISVLTVPAADSLLTRFPEYVDETVPFAGFPGIPEQPFEPRDLPRFYEEMVRRRFDLAIQMQGNGLVSNSLVKMLGARITAGYHLPGQYCPDPEWFMPYPAHLNEIRRHLALMEFLGVPGQGDHLEFPLSDEDRAEAKAALARAGSRLPEAHLNGGGYVCLHPGAMAPSRRWSPAGFAAVGDHLAKKGLTVVFTGSAFEQDRIRRIRRWMRFPALDLSGRTTIGGLAALIEKARLVVCNDTGTSHLAAALQVPSVVIFAGTPGTGSDPARWAPLDERLHVAVGRAPARLAPDDPTPHQAARSTAAGQDAPWERVHERGSCCLRDACTSPVEQGGEGLAAGVTLTQVLEAVERQLQLELRVDTPVRTTSHVL